MYLYPSMTTALEGGEWSAARPGRTLLPGKARYPLYRRLGGPQGRSGRAENLAPPGFDPRTVQPQVSRYTDWATRVCMYVCMYVYTRTQIDRSINASIHTQESTWNPNSNTLEPDLRRRMTALPTVLSPSSILPLSFPRRNNFKKIYYLNCHVFKVALGRGVSVRDWYWMTSLRESRESTPEMEANSSKKTCTLFRAPRMTEIYTFVRHWM